MPVMIVRALVLSYHRIAVNQVALHLYKRGGAVVEPMHHATARAGEEGGERLSRTPTARLRLDGRERAEGLQYGTPRVVEGLDCKALNLDRCGGRLEKAEEIGSDVGADLAEGTAEASDADGVAQLRRRGVQREMGPRVERWDLGTISQKGEMMRQRTI